MDKGKHGGAREGAGGKKPRIENKRESITVRLPPDLTIWLNEFGRNKGRIIERALRELRDRERA